jgi:photosystem II stability/assembly factor-like uncharacterized protein
MKKILLLIVICLISTRLYSQHWNEQIVLTGEVLASCFDNNDDILYSSAMSNGLFAVCHFSIAKDSVDCVLLKTKEPVYYLSVLKDGTILAFQDKYLLRTKDGGKNWVGSSTNFTISNYRQDENGVTEINNYVIFKNNEKCYISFDKAKSWKFLEYLGKDIIQVIPTFNNRLVGVCNNSPLFSSDFGETWEKTNLDTFKLYSFIYSDFSKNIFAYNNQIFRSENGGKDWEVLNIKTDTIIRSYDIDSHSNIYLMDHFKKLYKFDIENNSLETLCDTAPFQNFAILKHNGNRYRFGLFLDSKDNIYFTEFVNQRIYKFNIQNKKWEVLLELVKNAYNSIFNYLRDFSFSGNSEKFVYRVYDNSLNNEQLNQLCYVDLNNDKLKNLIVPSGNNGFSDIYEVGPKDELIIAEYKEDTFDSLNNVIACYSISKDNGFSRRFFYSDTNKNYLSSRIAFNKDNELFIVGNNKIFKSDENIKNIDTIKFQNLDSRLVREFGASPDGYLYLFAYEIGAHYINYFYRSSDNGTSWQLLDSLFEQHYYVDVNNIQFKSNGEIFVSESNIDWCNFLNSTDKGQTWKVNSFNDNAGTSWSIYSLYTDNKDNLYVNASMDFYPEILISNKNWVYLKDTCNIIATKCGDIFASIFLGGQKFQKKIYSSDNGKTWVDFKDDYYGINHSNYASDVYRYYDNILYKFDRDSIVLNNPLNDTTEYAGAVDVNETQIYKNINLSLYPNPATDFIEINVPNPRVNPWVDITGEIKIFNTLGECVLIVQLPRTALTPLIHRIDISYLTPGIYFLNLQAGEFSETGKIFIIR